MWDDDDDEVDFDFSFNFSTKSQEDINKEKIEKLSKRPISSLKGEEIFEIIKRGIMLEKMIPAALDLIESGKFFDFDDPTENEYLILEKQRTYFSKNLVQKQRFEKLSRWNKNSGNCKNPTTGKPRKSYPSKSSATEEASYLEHTYGHQSAYKCDNCGEWHLIASKQHTPSRTCDYCTDGDGSSKQLYTSESAANKRAKIIKDERGISLKIYECPHQDGWHLTKQL